MDTITNHYGDVVCFADYRTAAMPTYTVTTTAGVRHETELSRRTFAATIDRTDVGIGPALVDVVVTQTVREDGTLCRPSYSVQLEGRQLFGGFTAHLGADVVPERGRGGVTLGTELELELCDHDDDVVERTAHGFLGDRPAGTVEYLCAGCGAELVVWWRVTIADELLDRTGPNGAGPSSMDFGDELEARAMARVTGGTLTSHAEVVA